MKGIWYIIVLWWMPPDNSDTYNLPSYFYSCREGGQPVSQLVLVRQEPGNRSLQWETEGFGFCSDIELQAILWSQITCGQQDPIGHRKQAWWCLTTSVPDCSLYANKANWMGAGLEFSTICFSLAMQALCTCYCFREGQLQLSKQPA